MRSTALDERSSAYPLAAIFALHAGQGSYHLGSALNMHSLHSCNPKVLRSNGSAALDGVFVAAVGTASIMASASTSEKSYPMAPSDVAQLRYILINVGTICSCYGLQFTLFLATLPVLVRRKGRSWIIMAALTMLFISSTLWSIAAIDNYVIQMPTAGYHPPENTITILRRLYILIGVTNRLNMLFSDCLVAWRAWVLWPGNRLAQGILIACLTCSVAGTTTNAALIFTRGLPVIGSLSATVPLLVMNLASTVLVGVKFCQVGRVLIILFESGILYCALLIISLVLDMLVSSQAFDSLGNFASVIPLISGLLSTFVVLAIMAQEHLAANKSIGGPSSFLASIQFMSGGKDDEHAEGSVVTVGSATTPAAAAGSSGGDIELIQRDGDQGNYASIGVQIALFVGAAAVLVRKENRTWIFALSIVAVFLCSSAQAASSLTDWWFQLLGEGGASDVSHTLGVIEGLIDTSFHISYLVGDALVVWRAWSLWPRSWIARSLLATCMVFTMGKCIFFGWRIILLNTPPVGLSVDLYMDFSAVELPKALNAPMIIAMLLTNAVATILVGIRVWEYRRNIASALGQSTFGLQIGRILVLLLESGLFYCAIWICIFVLDVGVGNVELGASIIAGRTLHQVATAYPTFVILILLSPQCTTNSTVNHQISLLLSIQFDHGRTTEPQESIGLSTLEGAPAFAQAQPDT
uniref:Uncharacterized protein n=1 Tax=Schizophyllum commune (strain H4-8 / FGSC 9210) TaxID=578458 RepID=D8QEN3_SCHCM